MAEGPVDFDVTVVGGGPTGMMCAALAARSGFRVAIVEAAPRTDVSMSEDFDLRTYALSRASARLLAGIGAWQRITQRRIGSIRSMDVWDATGPGRVYYDCAAIGEPALGYIVEHAALVDGLESVLASDARVSWYRPATVSTFDRVGPVQRLSLQPRPLSTRVVVGADGAQSRLRDMLNLPIVVDEYDRRAVVANVTMARRHGECARQRFLPSGPLALLPMSHPDVCSIVWTTLPAEADALTRVADDAFCAALSDASDRCLGDVLTCSRRLAFPLSRKHLSRYVASGCAFIGDAAHVIHPLAGQGLNLGLMDAAALVEVLQTARERNEAIHSLRVLRRYERWRKGENLLMEWATDGLHKLFADDDPITKWVRNYGLLATNGLGPIKNWIMARASGVIGDLPAAALKRYPGV